jgi:ferredoxin-NADP reductase
MISIGSRIGVSLRSKQDLCDGLAVFRFELMQDFHFTAGQYATLWLTHDGITTKRPYSIASSPNNRKMLEFYIHRVEQGSLTPSLWDKDVIDALESAHAGTRVEVSGPGGKFTFDEADERDPVFIASGTGLAPFMSMIRKLREDDQSGRRQARSKTIHLVHGAKHPVELGYHEELERFARESAQAVPDRLRFVYLPTISRPQSDPEWKGLTGRAESLLYFAESDNQARGADARLQVKALLYDKLRPETHIIYVCGHRGTIESVQKLLDPLGFMPDNDIRTEKYS